MKRILELLKDLLRKLLDLFSEDEAQTKKRVYRYKHKDFFMTYPEAQFFSRLIDVFGQQYYVFAQVNLPSIIDHEIKGQNWKAAWSHINRKSVDYVLCETKNLRPVCAIELDDKSHDSDKRIARDREVERILAEANLPLLRFRNPEKVSADEVRQRVVEAIS